LKKWHPELCDPHASSRAKYKSFSCSTIKSAITVHNLGIGMPMHVLPTQNALFTGNPKCYFPNNTYDEPKTQRTIGKAFKGTYNTVSKR